METKLLSTRRRRKTEGRVTEQGKKSEVISDTGTNSLL